MLTSKKLCDLLYDRKQAAQASDEYFAAFVYSTAEDLADGMLKGRGPEALPALLAAYEANHIEASSEEERNAWAKAIEVAREVYNLA